jgi:lipopolysaccharide export system protein LptA
MITRIVEAQGNVIYEQVKPTKFNFTGDKAVGSLKENKLVVTGNNQDRVVTEIFPDRKKQ